MAVQQNKKSPSKRGMHRSHNALNVPGLAVEPTTGETVLMKAAAAGSEAIVNLLIERGADVKSTSFERSTALHLAARLSDPKICELLIKVYK
jgi:ribosomal protein L32